MATNIVRIDGYPMSPGMARDWLRMVAAAAADGVELVVTSAYRTKSEQIRTFTDRYDEGAWSPWGDYRKFRGVTWGRTSGEGTVQSPDVGSNHTRGYAVDIYMGPGVFAWLQKNAARFNFNHREGSSIDESWHWCWYIAIFPDGAEPDPWEGRGAPDPVHSTDQGIAIDDLDTTTSGAGGTADAPANQSQEDDMPTLYRINDKASSWDGLHYAVAWGGIKQVSTKESVKLFEDAHHTLGVKEIPVSEKTFRVILGCNAIATVDGKPVLDARGYVLDDRRGQSTYVRGGSWDRGDKAERLAHLAQKIR